MEGRTRGGSSGAGVYVALLVIASVAFVALDALWLGVIAQDLYQAQMGWLLADSPRWGAVVAFYVLYLVGLTWFAIAPAAREGAAVDAMAKGALFGLFTYATYDLTSLAVIRGFPTLIVPIDIAWGIVVSAVASGVAVRIRQQISRSSP